MKVFKEIIFDDPKYGYCFSIELSDPDIDFVYEVTFKVDSLVLDKILQYRKDAKAALEHEYDEFIKVSK